MRGNKFQRISNSIFMSAPFSFIFIVKKSIVKLYPMDLNEPIHNFSCITTVSFYVLSRRKLSIEHTHQYILIIVWVPSISVRGNRIFLQHRNGPISGTAATCCLAELSRYPGYFNFILWNNFFQTTSNTLHTYSITVCFHFSAAYSKLYSKTLSC